MISLDSLNDTLKSGDLVRKIKRGDIITSVTSTRVYTVLVIDNPKFHQGPGRGRRGPGGRGDPRVFFKGLDEEGSVIDCVVYEDDIIQGEIQHIPRSE